MTAPPIAHMTDAEWQQAAEYFGISDAELPLYQEAFTDIDRLGIDTFLNVLIAELTAAYLRVPAPPDVLRRLMIRRTVAVEVFGAVATEALAAVTGPVN